MSKKIVMKFGGTSVGSVKAIRQAASLVQATHEQGHSVVVVVSAMSGVTNFLIQAAKEAAQGSSEVPEEAKQALWSRHHSTAVTLLSEGYERVLGDIEAELTNLGNLTAAIEVLGEVTPRAMDFISSLGERFSAMLFAAYLSATHCPAQAIMADQIVVTDNHFGNANPLLEPTGTRARAQLQPLLEQHIVPIVTGFMGATQDGIVTTLGRGGSDYTAAILGHALDADEIWIWSDVNGILTADPRIVSEAHPIAKLSYQEAAELAYFGAKVLHPKTVRPAILKNIPIRMLNTFNPDYEGTWIGKGSDTFAIKGVSYIPNLAEITVAGRGMLGVPGVAARLFSAVAEQGVSVLMISQASSEQSICLVVREEESQTTVRALEDTFRLELQQGHIERIYSNPQVAIVAVVGAAMRNTPGIAGKLFTALGDNNINVLSIAQGSSEYNISLAVSQKDAHQALRVIHHAFGLGS